MRLVRELDAGNSFLRLTREDHADHIFLGETVGFPFWNAQLCGTTVVWMRMMLVEPARDMPAQPGPRLPERVDARLIDGHQHLHFVDLDDMGVSGVLTVGACLRILEAVHRGVTTEGEKTYEGHFLTVHDSGIVTPFSL
ncbi:hypothetical protein AD929_12205 [Gluconobacter potus]|uniref:Uncharacterized protein n=1 Tax=Gluconobacter potus TaxID=2724927 RepID=A0A149QRN1_9PROT|nr:hypothetical protein [Gluconobacter potus]KXU99987.1 hypothetical protein AD929_12205 [Gluconobacter potus]